MILSRALEIAKYYRVNIRMDLDLVGFACLFHSCKSLRIVFTHLELANLLDIDNKTVLKSISKFPQPKISGLSFTFDPSLASYIKHYTSQIMSYYGLFDRSHTSQSFESLSLTLSSSSQSSDEITSSDLYKVLDYMTSDRIIRFWNKLTSNPPNKDTVKAIKNENRTYMMAIYIIIFYTRVIARKMILTKSAYIPNNDLIEITHIKKETHLSIPSTFYKLR